MNEMLDAMKDGLEENLKEVAETAAEETVGKISVNLDDLAEQVAANTRDIYNMNACWNKFVDSVDKQTIEDLKNQKPGVTKKDVALISGAFTLGGMALVAGGYLGYKYVLKPWMDKKKAPKEEE